MNRTPTIESIDRGGGSDAIELDDQNFTVTRAQ